MSADDAIGSQRLTPADPETREEPLPWQEPKAGEFDPQAPEHVREIMNSPCYQPGSNDVRFINSEDLRSLRLGLDYLKPELLMRRAGVEHTIVVFGSTRIREPLEAERRIALAEKRLADRPEDPLLQHKLAIAHRLAAKSKYYDIARELGRVIANCGEGPDDCRVMLMTGGGPGIMEAANRGAHDVGGKSIGLNITLPHEQYPNPYISPDLCFSVDYFANRKLHFLLRAKALVVLPGGYGTLDELFETLTLIQTRKIKPLPVVLVGEKFWRGVFNVDFLVEEGVIDIEDRDLFWFAESAEETWQIIQDWHREVASGIPLDE
jgi:uncharacterized protein (TIGR00730 family)